MTEEARGSREASFARALWMFPVATALHNAEEAVWLPAWSARGTPFHPPVGAPEFRFAVAVLTALAVLVTALAWRRGGIWVLATLGYAGAMLVNVVFPHVAASVASGGYTPGVVTALVCNLPVDGYLLARAVRERRATLRQVLVATAIVGLAVLTLIPLLFVVGRRLFAG